MSESRVGKGRCLCGKIRITAKEMSHHVGSCHCHMCRLWGGGPLMAVDCGSDVQFEGEAHIQVYNSSAWAERGFCSHCGSHLFYRLKKNNQHIIPAGLFDHDEDFRFDHQIFIDEKPPYYTFANETEEMTGADMFAKYAPKWSAAVQWWRQLTRST